MLSSFAHAGLYDAHAPISGRRPVVTRIVNTFLAGTIVIWCAFSLFLEA